MKSTGSRLNAPDVPMDSGEHLLTVVDQVTIETVCTPGEVIAGKYRVERVIGEGAMGFVLAARHLDLDETVAIKFIRPEMQKAQDIVSRFAREAKATVRIKSEHIANVLDVGIAPALGPYIVMEYLEGEDLARVLETRGPLPVRRAVEYVMQACEALALAHANGIIHRDVKPENLFLTRRGELELIKVLDFGISKAALTGLVFGDDLSVKETSCLMGTPLYMSPEQVRSSREVDHRTDIWSLGAVLYELVSGLTAFSADSITEMCARVLESTPVPLIECCEQATPALQEVIDQCLQKQASERFPNVAELALALMPFAPSRARLHADRATAILRAAGIPVNASASSSFPASAGTPSLPSVPGAPRVPSVSVPSGRFPTSTGSAPRIPTAHSAGASSNPRIQTTRSATSSTPRIPSAHSAGASSAPRVPTFNSAGSMPRIQTVNSASPPRVPTVNSAVSSVPWMPTTIQRSSAPKLSIDASAPPVVESAAAGPPAKRTRLFTYAAGAGLTLAAAVLAFTQGQPQKVLAPQPVAASRPHTGGPSAVPVLDLTSAESSLRSVRIESEPSGATVSQQGKALGRTPLSTRLAIGSQTLELVKDGYMPQSVTVQVEPAPSGAEPLLKRAVLESATHAPIDRARAVRAVARPLARPVGASPVATEPPKAATPSTASSTTASARSSAEPKHVQLVEDQGRVKLLE